MKYVKYLDMDMEPIQQKGGSYTTGGPIDKQITGKIEETGARSITIEDINKKSRNYRS